ncbi:MAG: hypothetical protein ABIZ64_04665 [Casimicrobium sp.]|jgi:hypothetical protein
MNSNKQKLHNLGQSLLFDDTRREWLVLQTPPRQHETCNQFPMSET